MRYAVPPYACYGSGSSLQNTKSPSLGPSRFTSIRYAMLWQADTNSIQDADFSVLIRASNQLPLSGSFGTFNSLQTAATSGV